VSVPTYTSLDEAIKDGYQVTHPVPNGYVVKRKSADQQSWESAIVQVKPEPQEWR
jgi:hypothetical protein